MGGDDLDRRQVSLFASGWQEFLPQRLTFPSRLVASGLAADRGGSVVQIAYYCMEASAHNSGNQAVIGQGVSARQLFLFDNVSQARLRTTEQFLVFEASAQAMLDCATSTARVLKTQRNVGG